jgi:hypothetical protein
MCRVQATCGEVTGSKVWVAAAVPDAGRLAGGRAAGAARRVDEPLPRTSESKLAALGVQVLPRNNDVPIPAAPQDS